MQPLKDPQQTRIMKQLQKPIQKRIPLQTYYNQEDGFNYQILKQGLSRQGRLEISDLKLIIQRVTEIIQKQDNLIKVSSPVTIVGDLFGRFYDFLNIIIPEKGGQITSNKYIFLGNYISGNFSIQLLILLFCYKIEYKQIIVLLRGNYQFEDICQDCGFEAQCLSKYDCEVYELMLKVFQKLPISCLIDKKFLCIHGGVTNSITSLKRLRNITASNVELKKQLTNANPEENPEQNANKTSLINNVYFTKEELKYFLTKNHLLSIIKSNEKCENGYRMHKWFGQSYIPSVISINSCPKKQKNKGAILKIKDDEFQIKQIVEKPHPYYLPHGQNLITWSLPFVLEETLKLFYGLFGAKQLEDSEFKNSMDQQIKKISAKVAQNKTILKGQKDIINSSHVQSNVSSSSQDRSSSMQSINQSKSLSKSQSQHSNYK